ncbi:MAG: nucleoside monophosphate kinase, partial [Planctomycetota bacterium]
GGCILDGFPRTEAQAESLDAFFESTGSKIDAVIQLTASPEVLQERMLDRADKQGRSDDTPETILKRLEVYERQTAPLVAYYQRADLLFPVDGIGTPDEVSARIAAVLESRR